jgi:hypothetical protein
MAEMATPTGFDVATCPYVASGETSLRCAKCARPLMVKDAKRTPTGYVCPNFVRGRVATFYNAGPLHYVVTGVVGLLAGLGIGIALQLVSSVPFIGLWIMLIAGPAMGGVVADLIRRAVRKSRGQYTWLVAAITIAIGAAVFVLPPVLLGLTSGSIGALFALVPLIGLGLTISAVVARLRI